MKPVGYTLTIIGAALLAVGIYLGLASVNRDSTGCGSAFGGLNQQSVFSADLQAAMHADAAGQTLGTVGRIQSDCTSAVSDRKTVAFAVVIPGGVLLLAGVGVVIAALNRREPVPTA